MLSFGLSFLILPHQSVNPHQLLEETMRAGQRPSHDWWDEVYIPEKREHFDLLGEKRGVVFNILFFMLLPLAFWSVLQCRSKRNRLKHS